MKTGVQGYTDWSEINMVDRTSTSTIKQNVIGDLKIITVVTPSATATGDTINLGMNTAYALLTSKIISVVIMEDDGTNNIRYSTWNETTGLITFGTLTTGIHHITIVGY